MSNTRCTCIKCMAVVRRALLTNLFYMWITVLLLLLLLLLLLFGLMQLHGYVLICWFKPKHLHKCTFLYYSRTKCILKKSKQWQSSKLESMQDIVSKKLPSPIRNILINFGSLVQYTSPLLHKSLHI